MGPLSLQKGAAFVKLNFFLAFVFLRFHTAEEVQHIPFISPDSHSGFYFPPSVLADGFETTFCLKCLQIFGVSYMAGGSALKLESRYYIYDFVTDFQRGKQSVFFLSISFCILNV